MLNESGAKSVIIRCCSSQNTLHALPEQRRFRRIHGLQLPLHPQQILGWVLLIVVFVGTFVTLATPQFLPDLRFILSLLFAALFLVHLLAHLTVLLLDPADPQVRARPSHQIVPEFDRTKHRHVIENGRCHLCNITTRGQRTKHCSICNKCVPRFDHHCKWLNNCIGGRNYRAFLVCLISTLVTALAVTGLALSELVLVNAHLATWPGENSMNNATAPLPVPGVGSLVLITVIGVLSAIAAVLLIHLCFFHGYIACLGLTTYEYVRSKRERSTVVTTARVTSSELCVAPYCVANRRDIDAIGSRSFYRFCDDTPLLKNHAVTTMTTITTATTTTATTTDAATSAAVAAAAVTTNAFVCERLAPDTNAIISSKLSSTKSNRNFRLCFSYDLRTSETSIEVSSRTTAESRNYEESLDAKSSTPSPVSCCFSIANPAGRREKTNRNPDDRAEPVKRSCGTVKRIQTFLQARLKRSSRQRQNSTNQTVVRSHGNKVIPASDTLDLVPSTENRVLEPSMIEVRAGPPNPRPPARLPALEFPRIVRKAKDSSTSDDTAMSERTQIHIRSRRSTHTFSRKRPHFKIGSHVTQFAQLSPIPESEFSKPATPRSPSRSSHFSFPPLRE